MTGNEWISVNDRLPERFKDVLTYDLNGKIATNWVAEENYFAYGREFVTHWMPLPEPPNDAAE